MGGGASTGGGVSTGGGTATGGGTSSGGRYDWNAAYELALAAARSPTATTRFVDPIAGSDSAAGTSLSPFKTLSKAMTVTAGGDEVIVRGNGITITNVDAMRVTQVPSGLSRTRATIVRAETPFGITLKFTTGLSEGHEALQLAGDFNSGTRAEVNHVWVDGFIFDVDTGNVDYTDVGVVIGHHNRITRCGFRRRFSVANDPGYENWLSLMGSYNVAEDCWGVGSVRYGFYTGGPDSADHHNLFRRCVGRRDRYNATAPQPNAIFAVYGNNDTADVHTHYFQSVIAIDSTKHPTAQQTYGAHYSPKNTIDVHLEDSIYLNNDAHYAALFLQEFPLTSQTYVDNCVIADSGGAALRANSSTSNATPLLDLRRSTFVKPHTGAIFEFYLGGAGNTVEAQDNVFADYTSLSDSGAFTTATFNAGSGTTLGTTPVPWQPHALRWLVKSPFPTAGHASGPVGAELVLCRGNIGEEIDEGQWNTPIANRPLWPFPYEDVIAREFAVSTGANSQSTRGFCSGQSLDGSPQTLTRYIWEYPIQGVKTQIPAGIYP